MENKIQKLYDKLLSTIIPYLEKSIYKGKKWSDLGISVSDPDAKKDALKITFTGYYRKDVFKILRKLEEFSELRFRMATLGNAIYIFEDEIMYPEIIETRKYINLFLQQLSECVSRYNVVFSLVTPITIAVTSDPVKLLLLANTEKGAHDMVNYCHFEWKPVIKHGHCLSLEVDISSMKKYIDGELFITRLKQMPEFCGNTSEFPKIIPFDKTYGGNDSLGLNKNEVLILKMICDQLNSRQIGEELGLSPRTIESYKETLFAKTKTKNSVGLALYAVRNKLYSLHEDNELHVAWPETAT